MQRYALIKDGVVVNVILATAESITGMDPRWLAQWDRVERVDPERDGVVEPGSPITITAKDKVRFDRASRPEREKTREERIEERIAALEAKVP